MGFTVPVLPLAISAAARDCPRLTVPEVVVTAVAAACILPLYVSSAKNDATAVVFAPTLALLSAPPEPVAAAVWTAETLARLSAPPEPVATAVWAAETLALLVSEADVKAVAVALASITGESSKLTPAAVQTFAELGVI
jgi:hypothetical protein